MGVRVTRIGLGPAMRLRASTARISRVAIWYAPGSVPMTQFRPMYCVHIPIGRDRLLAMSPSGGVNETVRTSDPYSDNTPELPFCPYPKSDLAQHDLETPLELRLTARLDNVSANDR